MENVKISFCVTYYNQSGFVSQSLDSIFALDMPCDFEILVGDDGSADDTVAKIKEYQSRFPDKIKLFVMPREAGKKYNFIHRAAANRLNLVEHATGDFIMFLDGDDHYCATDFIPKALARFEKNKNLVACAFDYQMEYPDRSERPRLPAKNFSVSDYVKGIYIHSGAFVFKNVFDREKIAFLKQTKNFDDNVIALYVLQFGDLTYIDEPVYGYRQNEGSIWNSASELEKNIINAKDYFILSAIVPKFKDLILRRQFGSIKQVWKNRKKIKTTLTDDVFKKHFSDVCERNDVFIKNCLNWKELSVFEKIKTWFVFKKLKRLQRKNGKG